MLIARFFSIACRMPELKRFLWRNRHEVQARRCASRRHTVACGAIVFRNGAAALDADQQLQLLTAFTCDEGEGVA
jgi:hypothetical protein